MVKKIGQKYSYSLQRDGVLLLPHNQLVVGEGIDYSNLNPDPVIA